MRRSTTVLAVQGLILCASGVASANLLDNGNLDKTYQQEIVPGFFLPKPDFWQNVGTRSITGPYEDEMSSEPWSGPAPTPVTTDGANSDDWGVFFKPFSGGGTNGLATGHLYQDVPGLPGKLYQLKGWAGAESNALMNGAEIALEFLDSSFNPIAGSGQVVNLLPTLYVANGQPFNYKEYTATALSPAGTEFVRARASMIAAQGNPLGGGQAFVVDDFNLDVVVPEPASALAGLAVLPMVMRRARRR